MSASFVPKSDFLSVLMERGYIHQCSDFEGVDAKAKAGERSTQTYRYIGWTVGALAGVLLLATSYRMIKGAK